MALPVFCWNPKGDTWGGGPCTGSLTAPCIHECRHAAETRVCTHTRPVRPPSLLQLWPMKGTWELKWERTAQKCLPQFQCHWSKGSLVWDWVQPQEAHYPLKRPSCKPTSLIYLLGCQDKGINKYASSYRMCRTQLFSHKGHGDQLSIRQDLQMFPTHSKYDIPILTHHTACSWTWLVCSSEAEKLSVLHDLNLCIPALACPLLGEHSKYEGFLELLSTWMKLPSKETAVNPVFVTAQTDQLAHTLGFFACCFSYSLI